MLYGNWISVWTKKGILLTKIFQIIYDYKKIFYPLKTIIVILYNFKLENILIVNRVMFYYNKKYRVMMACHS